ncbi:DUF2798 domain-containing protein [Flavobacterium branchiicola]|uniref:DUF2798 domain-containing protein n=1 Tax=Flavobacterium branchiicola TaxID=1114875 RepID=A0ABV9PH28_9FLAO|nr:DUF2798 domain-containing protein [Flavobacterium branchiicola]MBS7255785.1 DUF2798 domain-containing protein [Flavobacterium branchiicola]
MKQRIVTAFIMGFITTGIMSFSLISLNIGFTEVFITKWLKSWRTAYIIIVPVILLIGPKVQQFVAYIFRKKED